jgi:arylsulfatase A-like enzyme
MKKRLKQVLRPILSSPKLLRILLRYSIGIHWKISRIIDKARNALYGQECRTYPDHPDLPAGLVSGSNINSDDIWRHNQKKNVVWFMLDSLRYDVMQGYLNRGGLTNLRKRGLSFTNAYANGSWTYPSMLSFLSGLYPFNIGASRIVEKDGIPLSECDDFDPDIPTIFDRLRDHGYDVRSFLDGWEIMARGTADQQFQESYFPERWGQRFPTHEYKTSPRQLYKLARPHLNQLASQGSPFLLFFRSLSTHFKTGYNGFFKNLEEIEHLCRSGFDAEVYNRLVESLATVEDGLITPVIRQLESLGQMDNTIVIIHSDHGDMLWNLESDLQENSKVGRWNMAAWTHNIEPYQALIKVPLLISGAGLEGIHSNRFRLIDLVPTLLDLVGISYDPTAFDGSSLRANEDRSTLYADSANYSELGGVSFQTDGRKLICSRRLGSATYPVDDRAFETQDSRCLDASDVVHNLRQFVKDSSRRKPAEADLDHEQILIDRLRGLGYL